MNIRIMKLADRILGALLVSVLPTRKTVASPAIESILLVRPGGIGDAVLLIAAINSLKHQYPDAAITVLAEQRNSAAFKLCPHITKVLYYDKPKELFAALRGNFDVVIDTEQWHRLSAVVASLINASVSIGFATNKRKRLFTHEVAYSHDTYEADSFFNLLEPLGMVKPDGMDSPFLTVPDPARRSARSLLGNLNERHFAVIFPGASIPERRWGVDKFRSVAKRFSKEGFPVVVVGGRDDKSDGEMIIGGKCGLNLAGKCSLPETAAVIERCAVLISGDSGVLHIGVGLDKPTVSLFGPGIGKKWAPRGEKHIVLNKNLSCSPCTMFGYTPRCPINAKCLADIPVDEVIAAVYRLLTLNKQ